MNDALWFWAWYACAGDAMGEDDLLTSDLSPAWPPIDRTPQWWWRT